MVGNTDQRSVPRFHLVALCGTGLRPVSNFGNTDWRSVLRLRLELLYRFNTAAGVIFSGQYFCRAQSRNCETT